MNTAPVLHSSPGSHHCRRVRLLIEETGMAVETRHVDVRPPGMGGENESAAFLELNPNGKVPVLEHGAFTLTESNAIMLYLCERFGPTELLPEDPAQRATILSWQFWQAAHLTPAADALMGENMVKPLTGQEPNPDRVAELERDFHRWAKVLNGRLSERDYVAGDSISAADLSIASALMYSYAAALPVAEHDALSAWFGRITARDAWQATEPPALPA